MILYFYHDRKIYGVSLLFQQLTPFLFSERMLMNTRDFLNNYYTAKNEDERLSSRHGSVEFITTLHYIEKYLKDGMNILELGAGSGRYSHYFARKGYKVDAVELIERNIELFRENTVACENVRVTKGDARDLSSFPSVAVPCGL